MAAYAALVSLMHIIDDLENHPRPPISLPKQQVDSLTSKVTFLEEFLEGYNPHLGYTTEADPLEIRIADAVHAAEDIIESHIVDSITNDGNKMSSDGVYQALEKVIEEMEVIKKEAMDIKQTTLEVNHQLHTKSTPPDSSKSSSSMAQLQQSRMVGADDAMLEMKDKLTSDRLALQVIPIVGMGGSGKTTLARNLFQGRLIKDHFHIRAWVTISQEFSIREILQQILKQLDIQVSQNLSEGELGDILHKHLYGRKYMIVLDDMWSIRAWEGVRMFLPNTKNGSRIVVTTRLSNLASNLPNPNTLEMKLLDEASSWDLLSKTVFGEKDCPPELEEIGKEIGKSCKGLALSIVVVGGLLAKSTLTIEFWEHIKENLNSVVNLEDGEHCLKILHMSYKQLPVHLKPCFLYMGVFPEDAEIVVSKLIRLWVAEGFLKPISRKSMEESARVYLNELTDRNLILIDETGVSGTITQCKIHDLLRDLCLREAQKERFITIVASGPQRRIVNATQQRRIVVSSSTSEEEAINALSSMPLARSLICYLPDRELPPLNLRLLRILELLSSPSYDTRETCIESMHQLVNSRYINSSDFGCPPSIGRFWNLQTLCSRSRRPTAFSWEIIQIRHIEYSSFTFLDNEQLQGDNNVLGNLQTLGEVVNFKCRKEIVKRIPNIKELELLYFEDGDDDDDNTVDDDRYGLKNIVCLDKLESLSCTFRQREHPSPSLINFPHSLKKLQLWIRESDECWNDVLDKIGALPLVQQLSLGCGRFKEGQWETSEGQFRSLKLLNLRYCVGLQVWKTECSHFPCLEYLRLVEIQDLEEIPLDLAEISTLKWIGLYSCRDSAVVSAKRIVEEQEESYGVEASLQVEVTLNTKNEAVESLASANFRVTVWE